MNGTVVNLLVKAGNDVQKDDGLLVIEAMKMEHTIRAPQDGKIIEFYYQPGDLVDGGAELVNFVTAE
jgi:3-methylcrotonyl-CoA carboxylase alpha subunit